VGFRVSIGRASLRLRLEQATRKVTRLCQQEQADLRHVRAGGDMNEIVLRLRIERRRTNEIEELAVNLLKVPGIREVDQIGLNPCFGRHGPDVLRDELRQAAVRRTMQEHEAIDPQVLVHHEAHGRAPLVPAGRIQLAAVQRRPKKSDYDQRFHDYLIR